MKASLKVISVAVAAMFFAGLPLARAADKFTFVPTTGTTIPWSDAATWTPDAGNMTTATYPNAVGAEAILTSNQTTLRTVVLSEPITIGTLRIDNSVVGAPGTLNNTIGANAGPTLTFDAVGDGPAQIFRTGNAMGTGANVDVIRGSVHLADDLEITVDLVNNDASKIALNFIQAGGSTFTAAPGKGITKNGTGVLAFADSDKSISGPLIINQGRVRLNANARLPNVSGITINAGGQLTNQRVAGTVPHLPYGPGTITLNGHGLVGFGIAGVADVPGAIRTDSSTPAGGTQAIINPILLQTESSINVIGATSTMNLDGIVSGPGALVAGKQPGDPMLAGRLVLTADNSYSGGTIVEQGTLVVSSSVTPMADLGTGNVFVDGRTVGSETSVAGGVLRIEAGVSNAIADTATLTLTGDSGTDSVIGGVVDLDAGVNETVGGLILNGVVQSMLGTYGSSISGAMFQNDAFFTNSGLITLAAPPGVPGDYNGNGTVDAADYVLWRKEAPLMNEVHNPGTVSAEDYTEWRARFGNTAAAGSNSNLSVGAVPEVSTITLVGLVLSFGLVSRRAARIGILG